MPTRQETGERASELFERAVYPQGLQPETAWLGVYQVLFWCEDMEGGGSLPHIIDTDKLRPSATGGPRSARWVERARKVRDYLAEAIGCSPEALPDLTDRLMQSTGYRGVQRQNPLGIAFAELIRHILSRFGAAALEYRTEVPAGELFPGVQLQSRSKRPSIDIVASRSGRPAAVISTKWSIRHDRLTDVIDESFSYRSAAMRLGIKLPCIFVTNEFDPARLDKVLSSDVLAFVVHVCPRLVTEVCGLNGRLGELKDIPFLVQQTHHWLDSGKP